MDIAIFITTLNWHFKRYPQMQIQDVYKLLYQAVMGAEHLLHETALQRLQIEWSSLEMGVDETLFETIAVNSTAIGRLNLRPAKQHGYDLERVWDVFVRSAKEMRADHQEFVAVWKNVLNEFPQWQHIKYADVLQFDEKMAGAGYPVMHHSAQYRAAYHPAYRVVDKKYLIQETSDE